MHIAINRWLWPFQTIQWQKRMTDDAERLLAEFGPTAYQEAADRCWREDVGLIKTQDPGHWSRVTLELGRRLAITEAPPPIAEHPMALQ